MRTNWPFTFYFLHFAALSALMPFLVLFYQTLAFNGAQIGLLTGIPPLITLVAAPFWTGLADARQWHKPVMALGILASALIVFVLPSLIGFAAVFLMIVLFNMFISPVPSLADSATMSMLGEERAMYGRIRLGGTIGWGIFVLIAGALVERSGLPVAFRVFVAIMLLNLFVSQKFEHGSTAGTAGAYGGIRTLLTSRRWLNFLFLALLGGLGSMSVASYLFPYMAELGANESTMGLASAIAILTEIPIFFFGNRFVKKLGSYTLLVLALVMFGIRSLLFALVNTPVMVLIVQAFGGMIFPAMWLAGVSYADEHAPAGLKSSAQGLFSAMSFGVGSAVGGFLGGPLLESIGGRGMFLVLGMIILAGLGLAEGFRRLYPVKDDHQPTVILSNDK
jgi:MFS transporter, PPP family, 3-phenylpropionic acid transporter